jgi:hypothetical protein
MAYTQPLTLDAQLTPSVDLGLCSQRRLIVSRVALLRKGLLVSLCIAAGLLFTGTVLALLGDLNVDGVVDADDLDVIAAAYGSGNGTSPHWDWRADLNHDDTVDLEDLALAARNYGDDFNFNWRRRVSNGREGDPERDDPDAQEMVVDGRGRRHIIWCDTTTHFQGGYLYYTQLDAAGNPLVEDRFVGYIASSPSMDLTLGPQNQVHIAWRGNLGSYDQDIVYARLTPDGEFALPPQQVLHGYYNPVIAVDAYNHVHLVVADSYLDSNPMYFILDEEGDPLLDGVRLNTRVPSGDVEEAQRLVIDAGGTRHFLWHAPDDGYGFLVYTRILSNSVLAVNQRTVTHLSENWNRGPSYPQLLADSQGAAHVLWRANDAGGTQRLFWRRINADGTLSAERQIPLGDYTDVANGVKAAIDAHDQLHVLLDRARYRASSYDLAYGRLDRDGNLLRPFHTLYTDGDDPRRARITVDQNGEAVVTFVEGGQPLYLLSSVPDAAANDMSRADLVVDAAHATITPTIARIDETATLTVTVWNGGWDTATDVTVTFTDTTGLADIAPATIAALPAMSHIVIARTFDVPHVEATSLVTVGIAAETATPETTLTNNAAYVPMGIVPPATHADFLSAVLDETDAPEQRERATYVYRGDLTLAGPTLSATRRISATGVDGWFDVPLDLEADAPYTTVYTLTYSAPGRYATISETLRMARDPADPYRVVMTPTAPVELFTNRWGEIHGTVVSGTTPLADVGVTLDDGSARGRQATTDASGSFTYTRVPSGTHALEALHAGNAPAADAVTVRTGQVAAPQLDMPATTRGMVRGKVSNDLGQPFSGATVELWADDTPLDSVETGADGRYQLEVADAAAHSSYTIEGSGPATEDYVQAIGGLTPGWPETHSFTLPWTETVDTARASGRMVSWIQEESWNSLSLDGIPVGDFVGTGLEGVAGWFGVESEGPSSYEVRVWWGEYFADLGLNYAEVGAETHVVQNLSLGLYNGRFNWYLVTGDEFSVGGPYAIDATPPFAEHGGSRTNVRVDRVELVRMDGDEVVETYWDDDGTFYSGADDAAGGATQYGIDEAVDWSAAAVRIYVRVGQYDERYFDVGNWKVWRPPVPVMSLSGASSGMGADYQCLTWDVSSGDVSVDYAWTSYPTLHGTSAALATAGDKGTAAVEQSHEETSPAAELATSHQVSVTLPAGAPARVGEPYTVALRLAGAEERPIYGVAFDLEYNYYSADPDRLFLLDIAGAPDLAGPSGTYEVHNPLAGYNRISEITDTAVVRLGGDVGLSEGDLAQITFLPLSPDADAHSDLYLTGVKVADVEGRQFSPGYGYYTSVPIEASAASVTVVDPETGGEMTSTTGLTTSVQVPPDAVTETVALVYEPLDDPGHPIPATLRFAGRAFSLQVYTAGSVTPGITFDSPILVTVHYDESAVKAAGLDESVLTLRRWSAATGSWEDAACGAYVRNEAEDWLRAPVCHLSDFGLFEQRLSVFLPVVTRSR